MANEKYLVDKASLTGLADTLRTQNGTLEPLAFPDGFKAVVNDVRKDVKSLLDGSVTVINDSKTTAIRPFAFAMHDSLREVTFSAATVVPTFGFAGSTSITSVSFPQATEIPNTTFQNCIALKNLSFPNVTKIYPAAFEKCTALTSVSFPKVTELGNYGQNATGAFQGCTALKNLSFPELKHIANGTFYDCSSLETALFPKVEGCKVGAFIGCTSLTAMVLPGSVVASLGGDQDGFYNSFPSNIFVYVPKALMSQYNTSAKGWSNVSSQLRAIEDYPDICDPIINGNV